mmetsp:Transcript_12588/g.37370  ORF Transcript_12588/g.37370 Transcript_12588/m.37370 type:complete len:1098 (+) Transcript_12588:95-3388(+)
MNRLASATSRLRALTKARSALPRAEGARLLALRQKSASQLQKPKSEESAQAFHINGLERPHTQRAAEPTPKEYKTFCSAKGKASASVNFESLGIQFSEVEHLRSARSVHLLSGSPEEKREEILDYFHKTYSTFERLHEVFRDAEAFFVSHEPLRHPPIFYLGHTASFYVNKLVLGKFMDARLDAEVEMQTAVGVDEMVWDDLETSHYMWPSVAEVQADPRRGEEFLQRMLDYRHKVREHVDRMIREEPLEFPISKDSFWWVILMGIEHERIHLETSSVIMRRAELRYIQPSAMYPRCELGRFSTNPATDAAQVLKNSLLPIEGGATRLGRKWEGTALYGWDNEFGDEARQVYVEPFKASRYLVTNREFFDFFQAGGYTEARYWPEEGQEWLKSSGTTMPVFWQTRGEKWYLRNLTEITMMPWDWPVEVNNHEATAYCNYLKEKTGEPIRLPTEAEYYRLRDHVPVDLQASEHGPAWKAAPGNVNLEHWASPCPVNLFVDPASGLADVTGNVWQHSVTPMDLYPGFQTHDLYEDFTTPTVDGLHAKIHGGSFISTGAAGGLRDSRYAFRRHFYQHAGFRFVSGGAPPQHEVMPYQTDKHLCEQLRFHFGSGNALAGNYSVALAQAVSKRCREQLGGKVLDLGCGPGRMAMELAKEVDYSLTLHCADLNAKAFQLTTQFLRGGKLRWVEIQEGELTEHTDMVSEDIGLDTARFSDCVEWHQFPDPAAIDRIKFSGYNLVVAAQPHILKEMPNPVGFLRSIHHHVEEGGMLVLGSTLDLKLDHGLLDAAAIRELLSAEFEHVGSEDLPYAFQETCRKFGYGIQELSFWRRRAGVERGAAAGVGQAGQHEVKTIGKLVESAGQGGYEDETVLRQYLDFHFGEGHFGEGNYPSRCAELCLKVMDQLSIPKNDALELGGGPGRAAFELSKHFGRVEGSDFSNLFVRTANKLIADGSLSWGAGSETSLAALGLKGDNIRIRELNAVELPQGEEYDMICAFNLIDRLPKPRKFLDECTARLRTGGLLAVSSPYTWLETFTPKEEWIGAYKYGDNDAPDTLSALREELTARGFVEAAPPQDVPFVIPESERLFQRTVAQISFWQKK